MPDKLKTMLTMLLIVTNNILAAQAFKSTGRDDINIHVAVQPIFFTPLPYNIDIHKNEDRIKIVYSFHTTNSFYRTANISADSIILNRNIGLSYDSLINRVANASIEELENKEVNKNRVLLDGIYFKFTITSASGSKEIMVNAPNAYSHPLLYDLVTKSLNMYREIKKNDFLNTQKTSGY